MNTGVKGQFKGRDFSGNTQRVSPENTTPKLTEIGISLNQSSCWQKIAEMPEGEYQTLKHHITKKEKRK